MTGSGNVPAGMAVVVAQGPHSSLIALSARELCCAWLRKHCA